MGQSNAVMLKTFSDIWPFSLVHSLGNNWVAVSRDRIWFMCSIRCRILWTRSKACDSSSRSLGHRQFFLTSIRIHSLFNSCNWIFWSWKAMEGAHCLFGYASLCNEPLTNWIRRNSVSIPVSLVPLLIEHKLWHNVKLKSFGMEHRQRRK